MQNEIDILESNSASSTGRTGSSEDVLKLSDLPLEEIRLHGVVFANLDHLLATIPSVKRMSVTTNSDMSDDLEALATLDQLEMEYSGQHSSQLSILTSLVSLSIRQFPVTDLKHFTQLHKLKKLHLSIRDGDIFDDAFWTITRQLTALKLESHRRVKIVLPQEFWKMATGLERLHLRQFHFDAFGLLQHHFRNLYSLKLWNCVIEGECIAFDGLTSLTALHMESNEARPGKPLDGNMDPGPLKRLRELKLSFRAGAVVTKKLVHRISELRNLESLEIAVKRLTVSDPFPCSCFESLGTLPNLSRLTIHGTASAEAVKMLESMRFLTRLEKGDIHFITIYNIDD